MSQPSLRWRVTAVAAAAVAVVLAVAGVVVVETLEGQLIEDVDDVAAAVADELSTVIEVETIPGPLVVRGDDDTFAQLVDGGGRVRASTANLAGLPPVSSSTAAGVRTLDDLPHDEARFRVLTRRVDGRSLVVGATLDDVDESVGALRRTLLTISPLVLVALAALVWFVVGRTLRPVEEANRRQRQFVADASHELRSPLTRIRTELEIDLAHPDRAELAATQRTVLADAVALQALVEDLLHLARSDAGTAPLRREPVDLDDIVLTEVQRLRAGAAVAFDVAGVSGAQALGDTDQLRRVVRNLLENAVRHARSTVAVEVREEPAAAVLTVTDDGPGIPAGERERVFERFTRLDDARSARAGGTGLGLAITREIVHRHDGTVAVDPTVGTGTRMIVRLPRSG